ncbi:MAG: dTMP kinase [Holosporaceae bacterium]|jgi:dTMP kinase|nr:dTMP kinase [Holosporaceae bacterium]
MTGRFITFEGGEGVGKTTQVSLLADELSARGLSVKVTREPGGEVVGEHIRSLLKSFSSHMDPLCEALLVFGARRDHFVKLIKPMLENDVFVICDRFYDSSLVYQGVLKNVSTEDIMLMKKMVLGDFEPDLTVVLDLDPEVSMGRLSTRSLNLDAYDCMQKGEHEVIRNGFRKTAEVFSFRSVLIDASGSPARVFSRIMGAVQPLLPPMTARRAAAG